MSRVHVVGVGKMGLPMAGHLSRMGHEVTVSDRSEASLRAAEGRGLRRASLHDVLSGCDVVVSSLPHDDALRAVAAELAVHAATGLLYVDTSTVSVAASLEAARQLAVRGIEYLRCPVSGNAPMAEAAQLTTLASGPEGAFMRARPLLQAWGPTQFYLGEGEHARVMKLLVNLVVVQTFSVLGEALAVGEASGLAWERMWEVMAASAVASPLIKAKAPSLSLDDFTATFTVAQMQKDVGLITEQAREVGVVLAHTPLAAQALADAAAAGWGQEDYAAIVKVRRHESAAEVRAAVSGSTPSTGGTPQP